MRQLAFIGDANWDIYVDSKEHLWAVPKPECPDCIETTFGDKKHVLKLMANGWFTDTPTEVGLKLLEGLRSKLLPDGGHYLSFN